MSQTRRRGARQVNGDHATTPTRPNAITAAIPAVMLETPTGPRFQTTPQPHPRANNLDSSGPAPARNQRLRRQHRVGSLDRAARARAATPAELSDDQSEAAADTSMPLGSADEDTFNEDETSLLESIQNQAEDAKLLIGLREISSLATWTLSSAKPGCALAQLRHPNPAHFWQSDGPQPHTLTLHFFKLVSIVKIRVYLDFKLDESYTPTKIKFYAGMSEGGLVEFATWEVEDSIDPETGEMSSNVEKIRGWIDISLRGVGGHDPSYYEAQETRRMKVVERGEQESVDFMDMDGTDEEEDSSEGDVLRAMVLQVRICENHQNGKDTHVRGFQVFANDDTRAKEMRKLVKRSRVSKGRMKTAQDEEIVGLRPADWMGEPEIR